ncbi:MAG: histidine phosphatase family protein [Dehalococcoidia bacterium]|nr:histidine phosphatase family protein [Dehalococcoidia bacterium]
MAAELRETQIYLIRHAQSRPNVEPIIGGMKGDTGLTDVGRLQAARLGERLQGGDIAPDFLYSSTLPRAKETVEYVGSALGLPVEFDDDLQELRPGECDGMTWDDYVARYGRYDFRNPYRPMSPGGEAWADFLVRVGRTLTRMRIEHEGKTIVAVTHGGFIDGAVYQFMGVGNTYGIGFRTLNASITHWQYGPGDYGRPPRWVLASYNDAAHIGDLLTPPEPAVPLPTEDDKG